MFSNSGLPIHPFQTVSPWISITFRTLVANAAAKPPVFGAYAAPTYFAPTYFAPTYFAGVGFTGVLSAESGDGQVTLTWSAAGGVAIYTADIHRSLSPGVSSTVATRVKANETTGTWVDTGVVNGVTYYYKAVIKDSEDNTVATAEIYVTPSVPLAAGTASLDSVGAGSANLSCTAASGGTGGPYTYQWYRDTSSGFTPGPGNAVSGATSLTLNDTSLSPDTYYYVCVVDDGSTTDASNEVEVEIAVPFDPTTDIPDLVGLYDGLSSRWQDAAGTTAATTAGQTVKRWDDRSGVGNHISGSGTAFQLISQGGDLGVGVSASTNEYLEATISDHSAGDFSVHMLLKQNAITAGFSGHSLYQSSGTDSFMGGFNTTGNTGIGGTAKSPWMVDNGRVHHLAYVRSSGTVTIYFDGVAVDSFTYSNAFTMNRVRLGNGSWGHNSTTQFLSVSTSAHDAAKVAEINAYLRSTYSGAYTTTPNGWMLVCNSLGGHAYASPPTNTLAHKTHALVATSSGYINASVGGKTTPQMIVDVPNRSVPVAIADFPTRRVYVVWEGTNDMVVNGVSGLVAAENLWTLVETIRDEDPAARVVVATVIDRNGSTWSTRKPACNAEILANYLRAGCHQVIDLTGITTVSADGANANATYFVDNVHLTATGYSEIDDAFAAKVDAAFSDTPLALTAGIAKLVNTGDDYANLTCTRAWNGNGYATGADSYTYQWHRSTSSGFTPGPGTVVSGATSLTLNDTGLAENTYYYKLAANDGVTTAYSAEIEAVVDVAVLPSSNLYWIHDFTNVKTENLAGTVDGSPVNGNYLDTAYDVSGNARNLGVFHNNNRPLWYANDATINAPYAYHTSDKYLRYDPNPFTGAPAIAAYFLVKCEEIPTAANTPSRGFFSIGTLYTTFHLYLYGASANNYHVRAAWSSGGYTYVAMPYSTAAWKLYEFHYDPTIGTYGQVTAAVNGVEATGNPTSLPSVGTNQLQLGMVGPAYWTFVGRTAFFPIYNAAHGSTERAAVRDYVKSRFGLLF